ncbi:MAG TPA: proline dehydrogenase family protein [Terriglobales bacterium]|jgi:proline dehydrogenase|nr:proline dehydrogenase family protein [Terriglobales bacterium]
MLRAFFISLSESRRLRGMAERSALGRRLSSRFVAGKQVEDALRVTQTVNQKGLSVSVDNLGENVTNAEEARASAQLYHQMLDEISKRQLNANVSLKLTHMGLDVDEKLARHLVTSLVAKAAAMNPRNFVRVDMEGSPYTQRTLDFVHELHRMPGHAGAVGAVIQSYMRRAEKDIEDLLAGRIRVRLCKGAYKEPEEIAFQKKSEVDANYVRLMKVLMKSGVYHGLATHDEAIINQAKAFAVQENIPREAFEFQMLYGIRRDLQRKLVREGWRMRVYIPFGTEWYPYFMRRLAERPANVFFIARNLFRK